jgi:small subunit ribosomal protein S27Ae
MQLFVNTVQGQTVAVSVSANSNVESLKALLPAAENQRLVFAGVQLEEGRTLCAYGVQAESTIEAVLCADGGKKKKRKKKDFKHAKKGTHRHVNVPMRVLKYYKVEGNGEDEDYKVTHERTECPHPDCGAGVFMAVHKDRQTCGKCSLTYVFQK